MSHTAREITVNVTVPKAEGLNVDELRTKIEEACKNAVEACRATSKEAIEAQAERDRAVERGALLNSKSRIGEFRLPKADEAPAEAVTNRHGFKLPKAEAA